MQPQVPSSGVEQHIQNISIARVLSASVSVGNPVTYDSAGHPATFIQDNCDGILIRVGAAGNPYGLTYSWPVANTDLVITHNLNRIPIGYCVTKKTATCDVYDGSVAPTLSTITLKCTSAAADTIVYIF